MQRSNPSKREMETQVGEGRDGNTQIMCTRVEKGQVREGCLQIKPTIAPVSGENAIHEWEQKSTLIQLLKQKLSSERKSFQPCFLGS